MSTGREPSGGHAGGRRGEWKLAALAIAVGIALCGQGPIRVEGPIRGQVIDRDSKQPIAGAAVRLSHGAHCPRLIRGQTSHWFPKREALTDAAGRFEIEAKMLSAPCLGPIWSGDLEIVASGYRPEHLHDSGVNFQFDRPIRSGVFELERWRYWIEFENLREIWKNIKTQGGIWDEAVARARQFSFRPAGSPGVFVSHAGSRLSRIAVTHEKIGDYHGSLVLAQDLGGKTILAWDAQGRPVTLPWTRTPATISLLAGDRSTNPVPVIGSRLYYPLSRESIIQELTSEWWRDQGVLPFQASRAVLGPPGLILVEPSGGLVVLSRMVGGTRDNPIPVPPPPVAYRLSEVLLDAQLPVECFTSMRSPSGFDPIIVIPGSSTGRTSFVVPNIRLHRLPWDAYRLTLPPELSQERFVACAGGTEALYLALEGGGIRKLRFRPGRGAKDPTSWLPEAVMAIVGPSGSIEFQELAAGRIGYREVVYAISHDTIYRFRSDGRPDQRIEALTESSSEQQP